MNHYVYEITNLINGKKYIGKRSCECPIKEDKYMSSGAYLKKDIKKCGIENFNKKVLVICDNENMVSELEYYFILKRNAIARDDYYNEYLCPVKIDLSHNEEVNTKEFREKISKKMQGKFTGGKSPNARKVICLTTGEIFNSMIEAGENIGESKIGLTSYIDKQGKINGVKAKKTKYMGQKMKWMLYEDYLELSNKKKIVKSNRILKYKLLRGMLV